MIKKLQVFKRDKWNMINVEINGKNIIVREISDQWGEDTHSFLSRPALMNWVNERFTEGNFDGTPEEREQIIQAFKEI